MLPFALRYNVCLLSLVKNGNLNEMMSFISLLINQSLLFEQWIVWIKIWSNRSYWFQLRTGTLQNNRIPLLHGVGSSTKSYRKSKFSRFWSISLNRKAGQKQSSSLNRNFLDSREMQNHTSTRIWMTWSTQIKIQCFPMFFQSILVQEFQVKKYNHRKKLYFLP